MIELSILGASAYAKKAHDRYQVGKAADEPVEPAVDPAADAEPASTPILFGIGGGAMGLDAHNSGSPNDFDRLQEALQLVSSAAFSSTLAAQLLALQANEEPPVEHMAADAFSAMAQTLDVMQGPEGMFTQLDSDADGLVMPWDLQQAVEAGGGSTAGAAALFAQLDPFGNGSLTLQQFTANLASALVPGTANPSGPSPDTGPVPEPATPAPPIAADAPSAIAALAQTYNFLQPHQDLFLDLDTDFDGMLSPMDIEQAVVAGGGSPAAAAALFAQLDPGNTGVVTQRQFTSNLFPRLEIPIFV